MNLSSKPLSTAQEKVLAYGPNFPVTLKYPPYQEYITAADVACQSLKPTEAEKFRADIARVLKQARPPKANISKEEWRAIKELRSDKEHLILTAGKGVALVVMDRRDYARKMKELLDDNNTYRPLKMDPTNRQKNRLIYILRSIVTFGLLLSICDLGVGLNLKQRQKQDTEGFSCKLHLLTLEPLDITHNC